MRQIALLRGINLGSRRRVSMPELRALLEGAGYEDVRTYVQSGNVVLTSDVDPDELARELERLIADGLGVETQVVVRTRDELAAVVAHNPLAEVAENPKRYQVTFLDGDPDPERVADLERLRHESERMVVEGREVYAWLPEGVQNSKLWRALADGRLGVTATARNWNTVAKLLEMADE
jgi:uncharacterized protein (DUF1697 family)